MTFRTEAVNTEAFKSPNKSLPNPELVQTKSQGAIIMKRLTIALFAGSLIFAGCSSDDKAASTEATAETTVAAAPETAAPETAAEAVAPETAAETNEATGTGAFNDVDVRFAQGGLGHHAQAVELAEIALDPKAAAQPEILELGKAITSPSREFDAVEGLLTKWEKPLELSKEEMAKMDGMATVETVDKLATLSGSDFNTAFLTTLVRHHEGAIKMAEKVIAEGADPELKPIAKKLLAMRTSELVLIKSLLG
jgi:uncharacterized protein (DUF305 family)